MEKARFDKMLGSDEIKTMIAALGCGIGREDFDLSKLRYHRIVIMTDADVDGSHIRTLLLTFFYRQMRELIEHGYVFIAQPPLYRAKRGRAESYIKDDNDLEAYLIGRSSESRVVRVAETGRTYAGDALEEVLRKLIAFQRLLQVVERRGPGPDIVMAALDHGVRDRTFFADRDRVDVAAKAFSSTERTVAVEDDEEHDAWRLVIDDRRNGFARRQTLGTDFVEGAEYRALLAHYEELAPLRGPLFVGTDRPAPAASGGENGGPGETVSGADAAGTPDGDPAGAPDGDPVDAPGGDSVGARQTEIASMLELVEHFIAAGKRGVAINRYKGLGEMNPDQLWTTTMNPENRTLLQVRAEDDAAADHMFTTLMGDQVEPRRKFIQDNALDVKNLDI